MAKRQVSIDDIEFSDHNPMDKSGSVGPRKASSRKTATFANDLESNGKPSSDVPGSRKSVRKMNSAGGEASTGSNSLDVPGSRKSIMKKSSNVKGNDEESKDAPPPPPPPPPPLDNTSPPGSPTKKPSATLVVNTSPSKDKLFNGNRFKGNPLQFGMWAHYMAYGSALLCFWFGITAILWDNASFYDCKIDGEEIYAGYIGGPGGSCNVTYETNTVCCVPGDKSSMSGFTETGVLYILYSIFICLYENTTWGYGLWFPNDTVYFTTGFSFIGLLHIILGIIGFATYSTALAGACLFCTGIVYFIAAYYQETGDGGREAAKNQRKSDSEENNFAGLAKLLDPIRFCRRVYVEDKMASYVWTFLYICANIILFFYTLSVWIATVESFQDDLLEGGMRLDCDGPVCAFNRVLVRHGPPSSVAPWAKACGNCLNFNCALLILPVTKLILKKIYSLGSSSSLYESGGKSWAAFFARPITRYIPLQKNIEFHILVAFAVFFFSCGHIIFHTINLTYAGDTTLRLFKRFGWVGSSFFDGAVVTFAMFFIYTAAPPAVRRASFEIFFYNHHWFVVFYLAMFLHGPVFIYWTGIPVLLYLLECFMASNRGNRPFLITKVEWIPPVMEIRFRPVFKEHFMFKEGQYLYLNCPHISEHEWHPFTISSAVDDLDNGPRIHLETGEEVVEVPRPANWPKQAKWSKYALASEDYRNIPPEFLLEKSETGYNDYVSLHIKVIGLDDPVAVSWTRKLKEYFELMNPSDGDAPRFPFYFKKRDARGDIIIGRQFGPDGKAIIRVDGPYSAPAEHYVNFGTIMLIGAGIGLTPCVSILTALTKYRWKKNFTPEIVHFYWIVRQNEVDSFQWLVHALAEIEYNLMKSRETKQVEPKYFCEINIYVTAAAKEPLPVPQLARSSKISSNAIQNSSVGKQVFTPQQLYAAMLNPTVSSKGQIEFMQNNPKAANRLQDIWIWNGRPNWDEIYADMKARRQHSDIGVMFCGAPVIGADLKAMCEKYSSHKDDVLFSLHKENF